MSERAELARKMAEYAACSQHWGLISNGPLFNAVNGILKHRGSMKECKDLVEKIKVDANDESYIPMYRDLSSLASLADC